MDQTSKQKLQDLLKNLENTQQSIVQASNLILKTGVLDGQLNVPFLVQEWEKTFNAFIEVQQPSKKVLTLINLSNDIIQKCKQAKCEKFIDEFMKVLPAVLSSCFKSKYLDEKFKTDVYKVIEIWKKREVFSKEFIQEITPADKNLFNQTIQEQEQLQKKQKQAEQQQQLENDEKLQQLPDNLIQIPTDLISFAQAEKDLIKWKEKSEEFYRKIIAEQSTKPEQINYNLQEYKRGLELQQKYRTNYLKAASDILQNIDIGHLKAVINLKTEFQKTEEYDNLEARIQELQEQFNTTQ